MTNIEQVGSSFTTMSNEEAAGVLQSILKANPQLTEFGFKDTSQPSFWLHEKYCADFAKVVSWLQRQRAKSRISSKSWSSYGLKEVAERQLRIYVTNGIMIAAAIHLGIFVKRSEGLNAHIGVEVIT